MGDVWVVLMLLAAPPAAPAEKKAVPLYTNADLERVAPFRGQTGVDSVPPPPGPPAPPAPKAGRGEPYWRREAVRVRQQVRRLEAQASSLRVRIEAERARPRRTRTAPRSSGLEARLEALKLEARDLEDELSDRARREGALPGWLR